MPSKPKKQKSVSADAIARLADKGEDISRFFTNTGRMMQPIQRVNVDLTSTMLKELDRLASELNVSRQAVIKTLLRQALNQPYQAMATPSAPGRTKAVDEATEISGMPFRLN